MVRLRPYKSCDAKVIVNWINSEEDFVKWCANNIQYPFTEESLNILEESRRDDDKSLLFTATDEKGIPIGFMSMTKADYERDCIYFVFVIVDSTLRNKGYGEQMLKKAIKYVFEILNVSRITLQVFDNNPGAHACYRKVGFADKKYWETTFRYKNELWGCYDMVMDKSRACPML